MTQDEESQLKLRLAVEGANKLRDALGALDIGPLTVSPWATGVVATYLSYEQAARVAAVLSLAQVVGDVDGEAPTST